MHSTKSKAIKRRGCYASQMKTSNSHRVGPPARPQAKALMETYTEQSLQRWDATTQAKAKRQQYKEGMGVVLFH